MHSVLFVKSVHGRDIWVLEGGEHLGFPLKATNATGIAGPNLGEDFDGNVTLEFGIASAIDLTHASGTDPL